MSIEIYDEHDTFSPQERQDKIDMFTANVLSGLIAAGYGATLVDGISVPPETESAVGTEIRDLAIAWGRWMFETRYGSPAQEEKESDLPASVQRQLKMVERYKEALTYIAASPVDMSPNAAIVAQEALMEER